MPRRRRRRRSLVLLVILAALLLWWCGRAQPLVLGTFNIRLFPDEGAKFDAVAAEIVALDADAFAVQEIRSPRAFAKLLRQVNRLTGRSYETRLHPYCRKLKSSNIRLNLGVVFDAARVELVEDRPLSPGDTCPQGQPPAALALLRPHGGPAFGLISVHFKAGGNSFELRKREWQWLTATLPTLEAELAAPVIVAGDFNSTGWLKPKDPERPFIEDLLSAHDRQLPTAELPCSEYWQPDRDKPEFEVSLLDHVLAPDSLELARAKVLGMCATLACAPQTSPPDRFHTVSDHCPVRVELRR